MYGIKHSKIKIRLPFTSTAYLLLEGVKDRTLELITYVLAASRFLEIYKNLGLTSIRRKS
jgi:hypothetical protein